MVSICWFVIVFFILFFEELKVVNFGSFKCNKEIDYGKLLGNFVSFDVLLVY